MFKPNLPSLDAYGYYYSCDDGSAMYDRSPFETANRSVDKPFVIPPPRRRPVAIVPEAGDQRNPLNNTSCSIAAQQLDQSPAVAYTTDYHGQKPSITSSSIHPASTSTVRRGSLENDWQHTTSSYRGRQHGPLNSAGHHCDNHVEKPFIIPSPRRRPLTITKPKDSSGSSVRGLGRSEDSTKPAGTDVSPKPKFTFGVNAQHQNRALTQDYPRGLRTYSSPYSRSTVGPDGLGLPYSPLRPLHGSNPRISKVSEHKATSQIVPKDHEASAEDPQHSFVVRIRTVLGEEQYMARKRTVHGEEIYIIESHVEPTISDSQEERRAKSFANDSTKLNTSSADLFPLRLDKDVAIKNSAAKKGERLPHQAIPTAPRAAPKESPMQPPQIQEILRNILSARKRGRNPEQALPASRVKPTTKPPLLPPPSSTRRPSSAALSESDSASDSNPPILTPTSPPPSPSASPSPETQHPPAPPPHDLHLEIATAAGLSIADFLTRLRNLHRQAQHESAEERAASLRREREWMHLSPRTRMEILGTETATVGVGVGDLRAEWAAVRVVGAWRREIREGQGEGAE